MDKSRVGYQIPVKDVADVDYNAGYYWRMKLYNAKKKFSFIFPLKYLFGFCTDYNKIL